MKKLLLLFSIIFSFSTSNAQIKDLLVTTSGKKEIVYKTVDKDKKHILNFDGRTATELYMATKSALSEVWVNPDEVIVNDINSKHIKVNGGATDFLVNSIGMVYTYTSKISISFYFKDDKMMFQINNHTYYIPASRYNQSRTSDAVFQLTRRNGKEISVTKTSLEEFKSFMDSMVNEITKSVENNSKIFKSDW